MLLMRDRICRGSSQWAAQAVTRWVGLLACCRHLLVRVMCVKAAVLRAFETSLPLDEGHNARRNTQLCRSETHSSNGSTIHVGSSEAYAVRMAMRVHPPSHGSLHAWQLAHPALQQLKLYRRV